jgi:hypothetical protein
VLTSRQSIQESRVLLADEVNGRIFSHTQHAQDIVIIMARVVVSRLGTDRTDGSLKSVVGGYSKPRSVQNSLPPSAPGNKKVTEIRIEALQRAFGSQRDEIDTRRHDRGSIPSVCVLPWSSKQPAPVLFTETGNYTS